MREACLFHGPVKYNYFAYRLACRLSMTGPQLRLIIVCPIAPLSFSYASLYAPLFHSSSQY